MIEQSSQKHSNCGQNQQLQLALWAYDQLFNGKLKTLIGKKIHLQLKDNTHPRIHSENEIVTDGCWVLLSIYRIVCND